MFLKFAISKKVTYRLLLGTKTLYKQLTFLRNKIKNFIKMLDFMQL